MRICLLLSCLCIAPAFAEPISFKNEIAPLLVRNCQACHGPKKAEGRWRTDTFEKFAAAGESTLALVTAKDLNNSELWRRLTAEDPKERMPLDADPLPAADLAKVKRWIEEGAVFDGPDPKVALAGYIPPPVHPAAPEKYAATLPITALAFSPDGSQVFASGYHEITVWNAADGQLVRRIGNVAQRTYALSFSADGSQLLAASGDPGRLGEARIFNAATGELVKVLGAAADVVYDARLNPAGDKLATAGADGVIRIFDVAAGKEILAIASHSDWVHCVAWSPDGSKLASGSRDKTAKAFTAADGKLLFSYSQHNGPVRGVLFPDEEQVISAGDSRVMRWQIADGKRTGEFGTGAEIQRLAPAGEFFLVTNAEPKIRLANVKECKSIRELQGLKDWGVSAALHVGTKRVAAGAFDGEIKVWDSNDGKPVTSWIAAPGYVPRGT